MKPFPLIAAAATLVLCAPVRIVAQEILFADDFKGKLGSGWSWIREHREAWRASDRGLEVLIEPGNIWGPQNDARKVLVRPVPPRTDDAPLEISALVNNKPSNQYEQVDLTWYCDDSNMVKLAEELVDGKLSVVMGREENDKTRTIAIIPLDSTTVELRLVVKSNLISGEFRPSNASSWKHAGDCQPPIADRKEPKISLQFYQGSTKDPHWARVTGFVVRRELTLSDRVPGNLALS